MTTQTEPVLDADALAAALATAQRGATVPYRLDDHEISALAAVAAAAVGLVGGRDVSPWFAVPGEGDVFCHWCDAYVYALSSGIECDHAPDCPALRLDAAIAALAGTGAA